MYAYQVAAAFQAIFAADTDFTGVTCAVAQTGDDLTRNPIAPGLVFDAKTKSLNSSGSAFTYTLHIWVESSADRRLPTDPDPGTVHSARVETVRQKLNGTGKAALLTAINGGGSLFSFRNWSASDSDMAVDSNHFKTPVSITGSAIAL